MIHNFENLSCIHNVFSRLISSLLKCVCLILLLAFLGSATAQNETRSRTVSTVESLSGEGTFAGTFAFSFLLKSLC